MILQKNNYLTCLAVAVLLICARVNAEAIVPVGQTKLTDKLHGLAVTVTVTTTNRTGPASQTNSAIVVSQLDVAVGKSILWVPPSSYLDLIDPKQATLQVQKNQLILTITGGDGSDSYLVKIYFDQNRVQKRSLASTLMPAFPTQETRYWRRVLKDE